MSSIFAHQPMAILFDSPVGSRALLFFRKVCSSAVVLARPGPCLRLRLAPPALFNSNQFGRHAMHLMEKQQIAASNTWLVAVEFGFDFLLRRNCGEGIDIEFQTECFASLE
jgi:hypothetical protein